MQHLHTFGLNSKNAILNNLGENRPLTCICIDTINSSRLINDNVVSLNIISTGAPHLGVVTLDTGWR